MTEIKLDSKDKAILKALEEDGRALIKDISKKTGIPRDSVNYRIKKMLASKVLEGFGLICDPNKLGYPLYTWVQVQLQQFDENTERKFQNYLRQNASVIYAAKTTGTYHYVLNIVARTIPELDSILRGMLAHFPGLVKDYTVSLMTEEVQRTTYYRLIGQ